jgi:hypothetical protein
MSLLCGIPSVTLEGDKSDWENLLSRLDKFRSFGPEPTAWAALLDPVLRRFVKAFDGEPDIDFWGRVCHYEYGGSGPTWLSGWITAFCVWSSEGKWQCVPLSQSPTSTTAFGAPRGEKLELDGVQYPVVDSSDIPIGFSEVDIKLDDNGRVFDCMMVSGHVAALIEGKGNDTLRPLPSWFMFIKEACEDPEEVAMRELTARYI